MEYLVKRGLPFIITLIVGTGLGSLFGFHKPEPNRRAMSSRCAGERLNVASNDMNQLKILYQPNTRYTPQALKNKTTGVVTLEVQFNSDRTTTVVERISTLPDGLTEDAERVTQQTRFTPAVVNGVPVTETKVMNYIYSLADREINQFYESSEP
jgi:hypothetical protein